MCNCLYTCCSGSICMEAHKVILGQICFLKPYTYAHTHRLYINTQQLWVTAEAETLAVYHSTGAYYPAINDKYMKVSCVVCLLWQIFKKTCLRDYALLHSKCPELQYITGSHASCTVALCACECLHVWWEFYFIFNKNIYTILIAKVFAPPLDLGRKLHSLWA